ncbi:hypothetical protein [Nonomuraea sp. NPDC050310]|uniref:hypothetical protein n=1 Tax=Nonomuraea sp. NPDC050310 TaxID=3154935 RepID=UPI0034006B0B
MTDVSPRPKVRRRRGSITAGVLLILDAFRVAIVVSFQAGVYCAAAGVLLVFLAVRDRQLDEQQALNDELTHALEKSRQQAGT